MGRCLSNKQIGTSFEVEACELLRKRGWWVHFCTPSPSGAQPCDIIACKDGFVAIMDAKTTITKRFALSRIEDNQRMAFERFRKTGNTTCGILIKELATGDIFWLPWQQAKTAIMNKRATLKLEDLYEFPFR